MAPTAVVTGGRGFLGRRLVTALHRAGYTPFTVGPARRGDGDGHRVIDGPGDLPGLIRVLRALRPSLIVHLAAAPPPAPEATHRAVTVTGTRALLAAMAAAAPDAQLLAVGSAAEFGPMSADDGLVGDAQPCAPSSPYGRAKFAATRLVQRYRAQGGRASVLRLFTAVGRGAPPHSLLGSLVAQLTAMPPIGGVLHVHDPDRVRDYLGVEDAAEMLVMLAAFGPRLPPVMNLCSGLPITVGDWITALAAVRGVPVRVERAAGGTRGTDPSRVVGDPATLLRFGVTPRPIGLPVMAATIMAPCGA